MSRDPLRQLLATFVIAGGVCVAGYAFFAAPANQRLARAQQEADSLRRRIHEIDRAAKAGPVLHQRAQEARAAIEAMERLGAPAMNEAALFAAIESLAADHRVTVERITPSRTRAAATLSRRAEQDTQAAADKAVGIEVTVRAGYSDFVSCVQSLQHTLGLCRIESIAIAPGGVDGSEGINASVRLTAFAITPQVATSSEQWGASGGHRGGRS